MQFSKQNINLKNIKLWLATNAELKALVQADIRDKTEPRSVLKTNVADAIDAGYDYTDQEVEKLKKGYKSFGVN